MAIELGYWSPVFGGWLRNVDDEGMDWSFGYNLAVARAAEEAGFTRTLVAELLLNDIKERSDPVLECWTTCAALAAATSKLRIMAAIRPGFHNPGIAAKRAATIDHISGGRFELNVVCAWWEEEARRYGVPWIDHDKRYDRGREFVEVMKGMWADGEFTLDGAYYKVLGGLLNPKPAQRVRGVPRVPLYAGGDSEQGKAMIASSCDGYLMHGDPPERLAAKVAEMEERVASSQPGARFRYGCAGYAIVRDTEAEARADVKRITTVREGSPNYHSYLDFVRNSKLDQQLTLENYSVSNRGLSAGLVGTPEQVARRLGELEDAGIDLVLLQMSPQLEEIRRFGEEVVPLL